MEHKEQVWQEELMQAVRVNDLTKLRVILNTRQQFTQQSRGRFNLNFEWKTITLIGLYSPVTLAIQQDHAEALELLLEAGASAEYIPFTFAPITEAIFLQSTGLLRILLQYGADVSQQWKEALHDAVTNNHQGMVSLLLEYTPLHVKYGQYWVRVRDHRKTALLELFINHAGRNKIVVPSDDIFRQGSLPSVVIMLRNGFFPSECVTSENVFIRAARCKSTSTIHMLMAIRPMILTLVKVELQGLMHTQVNIMETFLSHMIESRAMLHCPSLQAQCKANIIFNVGQPYMERVNKLPLPKPLIGYLQSLLPEIDLNTQSKHEQ